MKKNGKNLLNNKTIIKIKSSEEKYVKATRSNILSGKSGFDTLESYRSARTNIMFSLVDEENSKKIIITSAMSGDGKTTTCINIAITFAQTGAKVLIIDADLRCPRIHTYFDLNNETGLSNVLVGLSQLDEVIQSKDGIDCITAGHIPQNPSELLSSKKMEEIVEDLSKTYDYIFIDTPPVALVTDATTISKLASGVILVVRQKYTVHRAVESAVSALNFANAKILGFILNDGDLTRYSYRKKNYGNYNYKSYEYGDNKK